MDDLISRSALIESLHQKKSIMVAEPDGKHSVSLETVIDYIGEYPTVDAKPVVHGEWIKGDLGEWKCSVCREENCYAYDENLKRFTDLYCPNCGADMRKKVQE